MGTPESTGRNQVDWTHTIFHEHFHQYQSGFDNYYQRLNGLDLDGGDDTGMWMLNHPFPYGDEQFELALSRAARALYDAVNQHGTSFQEQVSNYLEARQALEAAVPADDWKYLELQLWMEGVARWTETEIALSSSDSGVVASGRALRQRTVSSLLGLDAAQLGREIVYPYGAAEAMLLERCDPTWRQVYPAVLSLGALIKAIEPDNCGDRARAGHDFNGSAIARLDIAFPNPVEVSQAYALPLAARYAWCPKLLALIALLSVGPSTRTII
jgi:hypothetical protein